MEQQSSHVDGALTNGMVKRLIDELVVEYRDEVRGFLEQFSLEDKNRFLTLWSQVDVSMRQRFIAFAVSGDDPDGTFLAYLDSDVACQEAVDIAFRVHIRSLHTIGGSIDAATETLSKTDCLAEVDSAKHVLTTLKDRLIHALAPSRGRQEALRHLDEAELAVDGTRDELQSL